MQAAFTAAQVRAAERPLLDAGRGEALMRRAAAGLATACRRLLTDSLGRVSGARVTVLAGAGNNGGDALFAAANLAARGALVRFVAVTGTVHSAGRTAAEAAGAHASPAPQRDLAAADLVIDGILGTGARPPLGGAIAELLDIWLANRRAGRANPGQLVVAVDVPTGVDATTGEADPLAVPADLTVTFGAQKSGLVLAGLATELVDIGLEPDSGEARVVAAADADLDVLLPRPATADHKYSRGVVGVLAGSAAFPGAGVLATSAAIATGVGMARVFGRPKTRKAILAAAPEAVPGELDAPERTNSFVTGPGAPEDELVAQLLTEAIELDAPVVLDAGALLQVPALEGVDAELPPTSLLTPHEGEFRTLMTGLEEPVSREALVPIADRVRAVRRAAELTDVTVLLKGHQTLIATPDGTLFVPEPGPPELATAGSGDVLAGILGALLATGRPASAHETARLAAAGVLLHNRAGGGATHAGQFVANLAGHAAGAHGLAVPSAHGRSSHPVSHTAYEGRP